MKTNGIGALLAIFMSVVLLFVCPYGARQLNSQTHISRSRVPLTVERETRVVNGPIVKSLQAWRSDGSHVLMGDLTFGRFGSAREIVDIPSRTGTLVDPLTGLMAKQPLTTSAVDRMSTFSMHCEEAFASPNVTVKCEDTTSVIHGYKVTRVTFGSNDSFRGTQYDTEYLVAPALSFLPLHEKIWKNGALVSERVVTSIDVSEPARELFEAPANYRVVDKLSEYLRARDEIRGRATDAAYLSAMDVKKARAKAAVDAGH